ncbi:PPC domain-containing protein, partial [Rhodoblastus acidophilus]|uniref:PPC domain-containing protein n=1 Tax=Rhodoblastus acidophilus TaxID=1074 RepID=UPI002224B0E0
LPNAAGTTLAIATSLGALSSTAVTKSDWVGAAAPDDYYSFTLASLSSVSLKLSGLANTSGYLYLLNSSGDQITSSYYYYFGGALTANLGAGTYYVRVNDTTDTAYTLAASAATLANAGGATLATATSLGALGTGVVTKSDWIGAAAANDYYSFTLSARSTVNLKFSGVTNNGAYLYLLDSSGAQVGNNYPSNDLAQPITLNATLAAGTYYIRINDNSDTAYTLTAVSNTAAGTAPTISSGRALSTAASLGTLTSTATVVSDFVGQAVPDDWYKFSVGSLSNVSLQLAGLLDSASISLLDANGNQIGSYSASSSNPALFFSDLAAGIYYLHVNSTNDTPFTLTASATALPNATGQSFAAATALAAPTATVASVSDWVGAAAPNDFYKFTLASAATVNFKVGSTLDSLTLYDANGVQIASASPGAGYPLLSNALAAGTYYVKVNSSYDNAYTLSYWTGAPTIGSSSTTDNAGNDIAGANATALGALTAAAKTVVGWVGTSDTDDYYKISVTGPTTVALSLSGVSGNPLLSLYDASGNEI